MRFAIFHNFMDNIGGAEIVTLTLAKELNATIFTTNINYEKIKKMGFYDIKIRSIGKISKNAPFRHQKAFYLFRKLNLGKKYDYYIISGDWAMSGAVNNKPNLWYVHSPLNELWAFKNFIRNKLLSAWKIPFYEVWVWYNRKLNLKYLKHVNKLVCNSNNTKKRIKKYYKRNAEVINPPIYTSYFKNKKSENFWLSINRLTMHKRIDLQMKSFSKLPDENLIIVGSYEKGSSQFEKYKKYLEKIKPKNVKIIHWAKQEEIIDLLSRCKGFITTSKNEDFGMTPIEAMASGKPVIAPNEGGYKETVIDGKTGILIDNINSQKIIDAINKINFDIKKNSNKYKKNCIKESKKYDVKEFIKKIKTKIDVLRFNN
ncbi:glycosyltransferase [Candidatus Woesearchaeota archaeon]|nr:glycosyltransferase [Candidatus Woesearchaeota archaeon]